jgi:hypothetical protein
MYIIHAFCFASHKCHIEEASSARITTRQAPAYLLKPERKDLLNFAFQLNLPFSSTSLPLSPYYIQDDYPSLWCLGLPVYPLHSTDREAGVQVPSHLSLLR